MNPLYRVNFMKSLGALYTKCVLCKVPLQKGTYKAPQCLVHMYIQTYEHFVFSYRNGGVMG